MNLDDDTRRPLVGDVPMLDGRAVVCLGCGFTTSSTVLACRHQRRTGHPLRVENRRPRL